jgi:hypothetical protein
VVLALAGACSGLGRSAGTAPSPPSGEQRQSEVLAAIACASRACLGPSEVAAQAGFQHFEPTRLPGGYALYSRSLLTPRITEEAKATLASQGENPGASASVTSQPAVVALEYRLRESLYLPAMTILENRVQERSSITLRLAAPGCGELVAMPSGNAVYGLGALSFSPGDSASTWSVCVNLPPAGPAVHQVVLAAGPVMIQLAAFPESGLTRDQVLDVARSLQPVR